MPRGHYHTRFPPMRTWTPVSAIFNSLRRSNYLPLVVMNHTPYDPGIFSFALSLGASSFASFRPSADLPLWWQYEHQLSSNSLISELFGLKLRSRCCCLKRVHLHFWSLRHRQLCSLAQALDRYFLIWGTWAYFWFLPASRSNILSCWSTFWGDVWRRGGGRRVRCAASESVELEMLILLWMRGEKEKMKMPEEKGPQG